MVVRQRKPYRRKDGTVLYFEGKFTVGSYLSKHQTGRIQICEPVVDNKMCPAEQEPSTSTNVEYELEATLSVQVVSQLNSDYCTNVSQGACTVSYWIMKPGSATITMI